MTAAAYPGNAALLRLMLEKGADIQASAVRRHGTHPGCPYGGRRHQSHCCSEGRRPECAWSRRAFSALHLAVMRGDRRMVQLLLDAGANVKMRTVTG